MFQTHFSVHPLRLLLMAVLFGAMLPFHSANAATPFASWTGPDGVAASWNDPTKWNVAVVPDATTQVSISNGGVAAISGLAPAVAASLEIGFGGPIALGGRLDWSQPNPTDLTVSFQSYVGGNGRFAEINMTGLASGQVFDYGNSLNVGFRGTSRGRVYQNTGTMLGEVLTVGYGSTALNEWIAEGDAVARLNTIVIGDDGNTGGKGRGYGRISEMADVIGAGLIVANDGFQTEGLFEMTGGSLAVGFAQVGAAHEGLGTLNLSGGKISIVNSMAIGDGLAGNGQRGIVNQSGGELEVGTTLRFSFGTASGSYFLSGGSLHVGEDIVLGYSKFGDSIFKQSAGSVTVVRNLVVGRSPTGDVLEDNLYEISGGSLDVGGSLILGQLDPTASVLEFRVVGSDPAITVHGLSSQNDKGHGKLTFSLDEGGISPIDVLGAVQLNQQSSLETALEILMSAPAPHDDLVLIRNDGVDAIGGTFKGLPQGSMITTTAGGAVYQWQLSYRYDAAAMVNGSGNDLALLFISAVPEPGASAWVLALMVAAASKLRAGRISA
jgi:hypothetical protein